MLKPMSLIPFHLHYTLSRSQRLVPLLRFWGPAYSPFVVVLFAFFSIRAMASVWTREWAGVVVFGGLALGVLLLCRGLFIGLLDVVRVPVRSMDVVFEENAAGILCGAERWYLFLDGITDLRKHRDDTWTIQHWNGSVLHIAAEAITEEQLAYIRSCMERGRTPEGIQAVIERGRRIEEIMQAERRK